MKFSFEAFQPTLSMTSSIWLLSSFWGEVSLSMTCFKSSLDMKSSLSKSFKTKVKLTDTWTQYHQKTVWRTFYKSKIIYAHQKFWRHNQPLHLWRLAHWSMTSCQENLQMRFFHHFEMKTHHIFYPHTDWPEFNELILSGLHLKWIALFNCIATLNLLKFVN